MPISAGGVYTALAAKANLASPAFTGTPTAPTAGATVNNTQIATTAMVQAAILASVLVTGKYTGTTPTSGAIYQPRSYQNINFGFKPRAVILFTDATSALNGAAAFFYTGAPLTAQLPDSSGTLVTQNIGEVTASGFQVGGAYISGAVGTRGFNNQGTTYRYLAFR